MSRSTERKHPTEATLQDLAEGRHPQEADARHHLEEGCIPCTTDLRSRLGRATPGITRLIRQGFYGDEPLNPEERRELDRRTRTWKALGEAERRSAPALLEALLAHPAAERREAIRRSSRFASYGLAHHMVAAARSMGFRDPSQALELAELAREVAEVLESAGFPRRIAADARALAWASIANAHRIVGDLVDAERAMRSARALLAGGTGDAGTRAEILSLEGSLRIDEARFDEAVEVLEEAARIHRAYDDRTAEGRVLMQLGNASGERGEADAAAALLMEARERLGGEAPGELGFIAAQSLMGWLVAAGRVPEARAVLEEIEEKTRDRELSPSLRQGIAWAAARLVWVEGDLDTAERELRAVRGLYGEQEHTYRYCLVTLDLALLYLEQGRTSQVKDLARELWPVLASRELHNNALQALVLFQQAAEAETTTLALLQDLTRYLRQTQKNPYLPYSPVAG